MKLNQLTFTRFIAALAIVIFHQNSDVWPFTQPFLHSVFNKADLGVSYFFMLSGFVMIIAYGKNKRLKIKKSGYYLNRVARIYPVYIIALCMCAVLTFGETHTIPVKVFLLQMFVVQSWFPGSIEKFNFPGWSLSVEALFYLVFPFLFNYFYRKASFKAIFVFAVGLWIVSQIVSNYLFLSSFYKGYPSNSHNILFYFPLVHLNEFILGNLLGLIYLRLSNRSKNYDLPIIAITATMLITLSFKASLNLNNGLMAIFFIPLILLLSLNNGKITRVFSNKYLIILGECSYSMYILQAPTKSLFRYIFYKLHIVNNEVLFFYTFVVALIAVSIICYYIIEIPAKDWIKNLKIFKVKKVLLSAAGDSVNF